MTSEKAAQLIETTYSPQAKGLVVSGTSQTNFTGQHSSGRAQSSLVAQVVGAAGGSTGHCGGRERPCTQSDRYDTQEGGYPSQSGEQDVYTSCSAPPLPLIALHRFSWSSMVRTTNREGAGPSNTPRAWLKHTTGRTTTKRLSLSHSVSLPELHLATHSTLVCKYKCSVNPLTACRGRVFAIEARTAAAESLRTLDAGAKATGIENVTVAEVV